MSASPGTTAGREARNALINLLTLLAQASLPAFHVQLARLLGTRGYGLYTWSAMVVDMFSVLTLFGMDQAVNRQVSLAAAKGDPRDAARATGTALRVVTLSGVMVALGFFLAAPRLAAWRHEPSLVLPLRMLAVMPIFYHAATVLIVATQARHEMKASFWARGLVQPLSLFALSTLALWAGWGVPGAAAAVTVGMAVTCVVAGVFYARLFPLGATLAAALRGPVDWELVRVARPMVATNLVWALQGRIDGIFLGQLRGSAAYGPYAACQLFVVTLTQVRGIFDPSVCASIAPALERGPEGVAELNASIQRQTRWAAMLAFPLFVLFVGFGGGFLTVFGKDFPSGALAMAVLSVGQLANALSLASYVVPMSGHARYGTVTAVVCVALQAVLLPVLVPRYGLLGAAASSSLGLVVAQGMQMGFAYWIAKVHGFSWGLARVALAALAALAVGVAVDRSLPYPMVVRFFAGVSVAAAVYLAGLSLWALDQEDRARVRGLVDKARGAVRARFG